MVPRAEEVGDDGIEGRQGPARAGHGELRGPSTAGSAYVHANLISGKRSERVT